MPVQFKSLQSIELFCTAKNDVFCKNFKYALLPPTVRLCLPVTGPLLEHGMGILELPNYLQFIDFPFM